VIFHEAHNVVNHLMSDIRLGRQIRIEKMTPVVAHITDSIFRNKDAFISLSRIKKKDEYTFQHSVSVCALLVAFCREMEYEKDIVMEAGLGGLLHDAGKMMIPDYILNKPGSLSESEFEIMKSHASLGLSILKQTPDTSETVLQIAGQHHERYDGTGYPDKLRADEISQFGQMAAIVDVYDALTSDRIYHNGMEPTAALKKLFEWSKFHFNPLLVQRFIHLLGIYPVGSLVMLESGALGVVVKSGSESLLRPTVRIMYSTRHGHFVAPYDIDLAVRSGDSILQHESPRKWGIDPYSYL
jgi:putative nucleotidyltransferase with HDIG domain